MPALRAAFLTPRNVCFRDTTRTYIDFFGRALGIFDRDARTYDVYGTDHDLLHEISYLFVLSTVRTSKDSAAKEPIRILRERAHRLKLPSLDAKACEVLAGGLGKIVEQVALTVVPRSA